MPQSFSRVKETFDAWSMYQTVVDAGYMHHAEIVATLAAWAQYHTEPLRIIDLGCGRPPSPPPAAATPAWPHKRSQRQTWPATTASTSPTPPPSPNRTSRSGPVV